jgi:hypothetical protein
MHIHDSMSIPSVQQSRGEHGSYHKDHEAHDVTNKNIFVIFVVLQPANLQPETGEYLETVTVQH